MAEKNRDLVFVIKGDCLKRTSTEIKSDLDKEYEILKEEKKKL